MRMSLSGAALPLLLAMATFATACPFGKEASRGPTIVADSATTSATATQPDTTAFPNSPNGSPASGNKGAPVVTDRAACTGTGAAAACPGSPAPSGAADTSDTKIGTPTTVGGSPKP